VSDPTPHSFEGRATDQLPLALAELHRSLPVGATATLDLPASLSPGRRDDLIVGAGFGVASPIDATVLVERLHTLPDTVGPDLRVVFCGLNPSRHAADAGVGFVSPSNRFWPAALAAGLVSVDRDPFHALRQHGVGMTDLVKRATTKASEVTVDEFRDGLGRLERLVGWLQPGALCLVGLAGWRQAVDRRASAGWQSPGVGGVPVYVMPSTSGLNASSQLPDFVEHLRALSAGPDRR